MKILLTIHHHLDPNSGAPGSTLKLGQEYQKLGHEVYYYSYDNLPNWITGKVKSILFPWFLAIHILNLCRNQVVDIIDASTGDAWVWTSMFQLQQKKQPLRVTRSLGLEHTVDRDLRKEQQRGNIKLSWRYQFYSGGFRLWEVATSLRCADIVFQLNHYDLEYAIQKLGVKPECSYMVANGIPEEFLNLPFQPTPESQEATIGIAQVGTYIPRKGIKYSVPALNTILARYPQVKVSLLGTHVSATDVYRDFDSAVRDRVQILPNYAHDMLPNLLQGHQIKLFPSLSEGFSKGLIEAMACGLAPIATQTYGRDILNHGHDGILIPARNSQAIEEAIESLIADRIYLDQLRRNAYTTAQGYSWANVAQERLTLYEKALEQKHDYEAMYH